MQKEYDVDSLNPRKNPYAKELKLAGCEINGNVSKDFKIVYRVPESSETAGNAQRELKIS